MGHKANWKLRPSDGTEEWKEELRQWRKDYNTCGNCGSQNTEVRNYDPVWRDGDVYCGDCGGYVRSFDAG